MSSYTLSARAYLKIFFHAAKHPHKPVNGVLLGKAVDGSILVEDAVPLLHHWTSLSPMMEIGLDLVSLTIDQVSILIDVTGRTICRFSKFKARGLLPGERQIRRHSTGTSGGEGSYKDQGRVFGCCCSRCSLCPLAVPLGVSNIVYNFRRLTAKSLEQMRLA